MLFMKAINEETQSTATVNAEANAKASAIAGAMQSSFEQTGEMGM